MTGDIDDVEARYGAKILAAARRTFQLQQPDGSYPRQVHKTTTALLEAELEIEPPADPAYRHGLFAEAGSYRAKVRLSNSLFGDNLPDGHGMALKLDGVDGPVLEGAPSGQHDLVLIDQKIAPFRNAADACAMFQALDGAKEITPRTMMPRSYVMPRLFPPKILWPAVNVSIRTAFDHFRWPDLMARSYHSVTPYRLGEGTAKFAMKPDPKYKAQRGRRPLREKLQACLDRGPAHFSFFVQPRVDPRDPVDDAGIVWRSPLLPVGRLVIPPQDVSARIEEGDRIAFSPWNALAAHEPVGSINALRRCAYARSAELRGGVMTMDEPAE